MMVASKNSFLTLEKDEKSAKRLKDVRCFTMDEQRRRSIPQGFYW